MKIRIEMVVSDDMDPSEVLVRMQETAVEWAEEFAEEKDGEDEDDETAPLEGFDLGCSVLTRDQIENEVSVQTL